MEGNRCHLPIGGYIRYEPTLPDSLTFMTFLTNNHAHYLPTRRQSLEDKGAKPFSKGSTGRRFVHMSYVTVPSSEEAETAKRSIEDIKIASQLANWLGFEALVVHMPRCMHHSPRFIPNYLRCLKACERPCKLLLENMTGCRVDSRLPLEVLKDTQDALDGAVAERKHTGKELAEWEFCLDTCHLFAEGQPMTTEADARQFIRQASALRVGLIHLNGSMHPFLSRRDQHCRTMSHRDMIWGKDVSGLRLLMRHWIGTRTPIILEREGFTEEWSYNDEVIDLLKLAGCPLSATKGQ